MVFPAVSALLKSVQSAGFSAFLPIPLLGDEQPCLAQIVENKYAQERNGWASDRMYKQVYAYTMPDMMDAVDAAVNDYFANKLSSK